ADEREHQDGALDEEGRPVDRHGADRRDLARAAVREDCAGGGHHDGQHERSGEPARRERGNSPGHGKLLFPALVTALAGCGGTGSVECACTMVWCTAGLITSSTGLGST